MQKDVKNFMSKVGQDTCEGVWHQDLSDLYFALVEEEFEELQDAYPKNYVKTADGIADLLWVTLGLASAMGMDVPKLWAEVTRSNMSKTINMKKREDGKIVKGKDFVQPHFAGALSASTLVIKSGKWMNTSEIR